MLKMITVINRNVRKKGVIKAIIIVSFLPVLVLLAMLIDENIFMINAENVSFPFFANILFSLVNSIFIPIAVVVQIAVILFHNEYKFGQIHLYKDIGKKKVYVVKLINIIFFYTSYLVLLFLCIFVVYLIMLELNMYSNRYSIMADFGANFSSVLLIVLSQLTVIQLAIFFSLKFDSTFVILFSFIYLMLSKFSIKVSLLKPIFIENYVDYINPLKGVVNGLIIFIFFSFAIQSIILNKIKLT